MIVQSENVSLQKYNTFGIDVCASHFFSYTHIDELQEYLKRDFKAESSFFILGGGSNVLFLDNYKGTIIHPNNKGISIIAQDDTTVRVKVGAGEIWDDFVAWAVTHELYGIENLSLIPGSVGAAAVQNIGAYGVEVGSVIFEVHTIDMFTLQTHKFSHKQCAFEYRNSIFKQAHMKHHIITDVCFELNKKGSCCISYGSLQQTVLSLGEISLHNVRKAVIEVRNQKLPNPNEIGNAGSFFTNPIVSKDVFNKIQQKYPDIVWYAAPDNMVKIAAGWLIDKLGLKGFSLGLAQVHSKQALVLINKGGATGRDIQKLAEYIQDKVFNETGIELKPEVIYI